jgi:hypothetical protein
MKGLMRVLPLVATTVWVAFFVHRKTGYVQFVSGMYVTKNQCMKGADRRHPLFDGVYYLPMEGVGEQTLTVSSYRVVCYRDTQYSPR